MLTRSKIKLQESVRQVQHDLPYFNREEDSAPTHMYKHSKVQHNAKVTGPPSEHYRTQYSDFNANEARRSNPARNEILKELRQEYQILKSLPVEDSIHINGKKYEQNGHKYSQSSSLSSSMRSRKSGARVVEQRSLKHTSRQVQNIHLEKKQLEIVIGNSMRKFEELLNNEILLKKTIHELRNQIEGRGGVHQEYEKTIKGLKRNEEDLQDELSKARLENQKAVLKAKETWDKLRAVEGELSGKDREIKQGFEEQKRLHELLRIEKDKYLNLEIQCKTYKMEMSLLEKEKNNEISRLVRQFQAKEGGNQKEMAYIIKKLEEDLKDRDRKCHDLLVEREQLKRTKEEPVAVVEKVKDKTHIEEMLYKSREMNDQNSKALTDSVNLIIVRMAEIEKKNEETLKREIEALKRKADDAKRSGNDVELISRITELERVLEREALEKGRLVQEIKRLREQLLQQENRSKQLERRAKQQDEQNLELKEEIERLEQLKTQLATLHVDYSNLQEGSNYNAQQLTSLQEELNAKRDELHNITIANREREKRNEQEVKALKRKADVAEFETEKVRREAEFNLSLLRAEHDREAKRIVDENTRLTDRLRELEEQLARLKLSAESKTNSREFEQSGLRSTVESIRAKAQEDLLSQKRFYDEKLSALDARHAQDMKEFNQKFIAISSANEKQVAQLASYSRLETEVLELRRALRQTLSSNATLHHLWDVKEAEYGNLNEVLSSMRTY